MSQLKVSSNLFLESQELNRLVKFLDEDGFRQMINDISLSYGLVYKNDGTSFTNGEVVTGTNTGTIKIKELKGIDSDGLQICLPETDNISLVNDNQFYWVKVKHVYSSTEIGMVSVDSSGNLSGSGTEFLTVLRGQPNFPVKIAFIGSSLNTGEYEVVSIINDTSAVLSGIFAAENNLYYKIIGSFSPGYTVPSGDKYIYQYDSCEIDITELSPTVSSIPTLITNKQFPLARVRRNGSTITIQDYRTSIWKLKAEYNQNSVPIIQNPILGIEKITYDIRLSDFLFNQVYVGWGFRSTTWSLNYTTKQITLQGEGGRMHASDTTNFTDGDFDGWRVYDSFGNFMRVLSSIKSGNQIIVTVDAINLSSSLLAYTTQQLLVVPDAEEIELDFIGDYTPGAPTSYNPAATEKFVFPINLGFAKCPLKAAGDSNSAGYAYASFKYKSGNNYSKSFAYVDGEYYDANQFDEYGVLIGSPSYETYTGSYFILGQSPNCYSRRFGADLDGITELTYAQVTDPTFKLTVGRENKNVTITGGGIIVSTGKWIILGITNARIGSEFIINFKSAITKPILSTSTPTIRQTTDSLLGIYTEIGAAPGTFALIKDIHNFELKMIDYGEGGFTVKLIYTGNVWKIQQITSVEELVWQGFLSYEADWVQDTILPAIGIYDKNSGNVFFEGAIMRDLTGATISTDIKIATVYPEVCPIGRSVFFLVHSNDADASSKTIMEIKINGEVWLLCATFNMSLVVSERVFIENIRYNKYV